MNPEIGNEPSAESYSILSNVHGKYLLQIYLG